MTTALIAPKTCSKCKGEGTYRDIRVCAKCGGRGEVETDRATLEAAKAAAAATLAFRSAARDFSVSAFNGLVALEDREPARAAKAQASFEAGRADVFPALAAYFRSTF